MKRYSSGKLLRSFKVLSRADRIRIILLVSAQTIFSLLDLLGVATIGVIGALAISGVQSKSPGNRVSSLLNTLNLDGYGIQIQVAVLATGAVLLLVSKTLFSIYFTRKSIRFLARKGAELHNRSLGYCCKCRFRFCCADSNWHRAFLRGQPHCIMCLQFVRSRSFYSLQDYA